MRGLSLKFRLGACLIGVVVIVTVILCTSAYQVFHRQLTRNLDRLLLSQADAVTVSLGVDHAVEEGRKEIQAYFSMLAQADQVVHRVWFESQTEDFVASHGREDWPLKWVADEPTAPSVGQHVTSDVTMEGAAYRLLWTRQPNPRSSSADERAINIIIAEPKHTFRQVREFVGGKLPHVVLVLGASILAILWILRWGLSPVTELTSHVRELSGENLRGLSLDVRDAPAELRAFVVAWDEMVERLALAMHQQRRFTADASHELRTPLATVKSTLQTALSRERSPQEYVRALNRALESVTKLEHLAMQLLALARLDSIAASLEKETVDLREIALSVCERYAPFAEQRNSTIDVQLDEANVRGNAEQLECMLANLVDNAVKHGPADSQIRVIIAAGSDQIRITVRDAGGSIPDVEQARVFDRFYRLQKARERSSGGTGLGLTLAQEIAEKHGGRITVVSRPGYGTDFEVCLPLSV